MSELQGEPDFGKDAEEAAKAIYEATQAMTGVKAYILTEHEMEEFRKAQDALRNLNESFDKHRDTDGGE